MLGILGTALGALVLGVACSGPCRGGACECLDRRSGEVLADEPHVEPSDAGGGDLSRSQALIGVGESKLDAGRPAEAEAEADLRCYIDSNPTSPRLHGAYRDLATALQRQGRGGEALKIYRGAIERYGDDPANRCVEPMLLACLKLHKEHGETIALERELGALCSRARSSKRHTLAARCAWLLARLAKKPCPESTRQTYTGLAHDIPLDRLPPTIAIDIAEYLVDSGCPIEAEPLLRHLAGEVGTAEGRRALATLGIIAAEGGDPDEALAIFETFERENPKSRRLPRILESHAALLVSLSRHAEALAVLDAMIHCKKTKGPAAARALCLIGESHEALGQPERAIPYYKRAHGMYADCPDAAARAYLASGRILEKLHLWDSARATYEEFLGQSDVDALGECQIARDRLRAIP